MVVTPMEVVKIRLQAQQHSLADPLEAPRYRNAGHAVYAIVREEGFSALYRGVTLTALRQATNQGACSPLSLIFLARFFHLSIFTFSSFVSPTLLWSGYAASPTHTTLTSVRLNQEC